MVCIYVGLFVLTIILLLAFLWISTLSSIPINRPVTIYYWTGDPLEVNAVEALQYLQNNPGITGNYLMNNVSLVPFDTGKELNLLLQEAITAGAATAITTTGTPLLQSAYETLIAYPRFQLLNLFSTADVLKPANVIRFPVPDNITFIFVISQIPQNTVIFYDPSNSWAVNSADYFSLRGFNIIPYNGIATTLPDGVPIMIAANTLTPIMIDFVPLSCPKLYGLDGSAFYPLPEVTRLKAIEKQFECFTYSPQIRPPMIDDVELAIGKQVNYIFPLAFDAIGYAQKYLQGYSNNTIQTTTTGFTGSLVMLGNSRRYGNVSRYQLELPNIWVLKETVVINNAGTCTITEPIV